VLLAGAPAAAERVWAIPADQGPAVYALLPPEGAKLAPTQLEVTDVDIRRETVEVQMGGAGHATVRVRLIHPSKGSPAAPRTRHFAVEAPAADPAGLAPALAAYLTAHESAASPWREFGTESGPGVTPTRGRHRHLWLAGGVAAALGLLIALRRRRRAAAGPPPPTV
jgi:hypothetical protein